MTSRIVNHKQYRRMPWKNGGGETIEIAIFPQDAGLDDFDWRISMASVTSDGPFSAFGGMDRTLCVLSGNGISLAIGGSEPRRHDPSSIPFSFPGDVPIVARLVDGPITDLNVMTRRDGWRHRVRRLDMATGHVLALHSIATATAVYCQGGAAQIDGGTGPVLTAGATLFVESSDFGLRAIEPTTTFLIEIERIGNQVIRRAQVSGTFPYQ
jgi:environmental stress-induced protein Ves